MENVKILKWIEKGPGPRVRFNSDHRPRYSDGSGSGAGYGYVDGTGCGYVLGNGAGYGSGFGAGYGTGDGFGAGCGTGDGSGIKTFDGKSVYMIDGIRTIISSIKGNLAKGYILNQDFTLSPCYVCKGNGYFAHGETLKRARQALQEKIFVNMDIDETINRFMSTFEKKKKYSAREFYNWHHYLTGSCETGRKSFMQDKNITFDDMYTVDEFITMCEESYGGEIIKQLKEKWNEE